MQERLDESREYWLTHDKDDLAARVAALHKQRNEISKEVIVSKVLSARDAISQFFISGHGVEVGAGSRPFPLPDGAKCYYGDVRDGEALNKYFSATRINNDGFIDAQTFDGITENSLDFLISAHVIEHLEDPISSIKNGINVLKPGGFYILVVPDRRYTFDLHRSGTSIEHLLKDEKDGGKSTRLDDYTDFVRNVSVKYFNHPIPEQEIENHAIEISNKNHDIHFHAWNTIEFLALLRFISGGIFSIVGNAQVVNENIFVLKKI